MRVWPPSFQGQVTQFTFLDHLYTIITVANHNVFFVQDESIGKYVDQMMAIKITVLFLHFMFEKI